MPSHHLRKSQKQKTAKLVALFAVCIIPSYSNAQTTESTQSKPAPQQNSATSNYSTRLKSDWHFEVTYGLSPADIEAPYWNTNVDPAAEEQRSTVGVLSQTRYSHSVEFPFNPTQAIRAGLSLLNEQSASANSWTKNILKNSKSPEWRASGLGADLFLLRHVSNESSFDAGLQADYYLSGVTTLSGSETTSTPLPLKTRLTQKSGWRMAFTGGITFGFLGPIGLITRVSGYVMEATFNGHTQPLRAQGFQLQIGADLALGRGDP